MKIQHYFITKKRRIHISIIGEYEQCQQFASAIYDLPGCYSERWTMKRINEQAQFAIICRTYHLKPFTEKLEKLMDKYCK